MWELLQIGPGGTGLVNGALIVLIILFLTVPLAFVLAERLRNRGLTYEDEEEYDDRSARVIEYRGGSMGSGRRSVSKGITGDDEEDSMDEIPIVLSDDVNHGFVHERVPREIGFIAADRVFDHPIDFNGHLHVSRRVVVHGDTKVSGSLSLDEGAHLDNDVHCGGSFYTRPGSRVDGKAFIAGNAYLSRATHLQDLDVNGAVVLEEGAMIDGSLEASELRMLDDGSAGPAATDGHMDVEYDLYQQDDEPVEYEESEEPEADEPDKPSRIQKMAKWAKRVWKDA